MKRFPIYLFSFLTILFMGSCDVIEGPYLEDYDIIDPGEGEIPLNVLLLEFTGHTCKSCPKAHRTIGQIEEIYQGRIVTVAIHAGYFARTSGDKYTMDFRTAEGNELERFFEPAVFPIGIVNKLDRNSLSPYSSWPSEAASLIYLEAPVEIITSSVYNSLAGEVDVNVRLIRKSALKDDTNLAVYLVEDGIISWQKDEDKNPIDVEDYVHNNVFRTSAGSVWGEKLSEPESHPATNSNLTKKLRMDPSWIPENCTVVSFLYETTSRDVIQCTSEKLIKQ